MPCQPIDARASMPLYPTRPNHGTPSDRMPTRPTYNLSTTNITTPSRRPRIASNLHYASAQAHQHGAPLPCQGLRVAAPRPALGHHTGISSRSLRAARSTCRFREPVHSSIIFVDCAACSKRTRRAVPESSPNESQPQMPPWPSHWPHTAPANKVESKRPREQTPSSIAAQFRRPPGQNSPRVKPETRMLCADRVGNGEGSANKNCPIHVYLPFWE